MSGTTSTLGAFGAGATAALWAASASLLALAVLLALRLRADFRRDRARQRDSAGLTRAYAELSAAKAAAEARSAQLDATLAGMSDGVMILDAEFRLVQWNERFAELTGVPRELLTVGRPMQAMIEAQVRAGEFGDVDVVQEVAQRIGRVKLGQSRVVVERTRPNGQVIELRRNALPGGGSVTLYTDVSARRRAEAALQEVDSTAATLAAQQVGFVAMAWRELAQPLATLMAQLRLLSGRVPPAGAGDPVSRALQGAVAAGEAIAGRMRDVLDMARLDAGQLALEEADFGLRALLVEAAAKATPAARAAGLVLETEIAGNLPARLHGDAGRLGRVLAGFLDHALAQAGAEGAGRVRLRASRLDLGAPMLRLAVAHGGTPLSPEAAAGLFELAPESEEGGTLHLAIGARLVRLMGGAVGVAPGSGGNELWLTLPLRPADGAAAARPGAVAGLRGPRRRRALVLLVEDMPVNQVVTAITLRRDGHRVDVATSGREALAMARRRAYDVVLMDLMMPGMSGYQATAALRALPGPAGQAAIFALTATNAAADRARCLRAGMRGMLSKPVSAGELSAAVALLPRVEGEPAAASPAASAPPPDAAPADEPAVPAGSGLLLDAGRLDALRGGLPHGVFASLARQCVMEMREQMMSLHEALDTGSAAAAAAAAHALAGMAANYGMPAIERRMRAILAAARQGEVSAARAAGQGAAAELDRTDRALELLLQLHEA